jgi:hypothetical protein
MVQLPPRPGDDNEDMVEDDTNRNDTSLSSTDIEVNINTAT